ncbi:MAG: type IX secretion system outer membrane channel protein PorV [Calditrichaceae bacterium]|nr:type IX secretion system outer membrane channel protein PorV [Calditrichaceae bacterium]MBN2709186.1 type IX secretion system outer membrane channel protein PorV [Calditrichaceae bacterium]RQV96142.1 MAG: type IX secretion system outer membrane channel protein PorV [Calditrichota bacterium]
MKRILGILSLTLLMIIPDAQIFAQGEAAVPFLMIAPGARNGGMGEGGVALPNDVNAIYWNPAGLALQYEDPEFDFKNQISLMHVKWLPQFNFSDLWYDYLAARFYLEDIGMLGFSITYLNLGENQWTSAQGELLGTFDSKEYAIGVSYAAKIKPNLALGTTLKYIRSDLSPIEVTVGNERGEGRAHSLAVDLGVLWTPAFEFFENRLNAGMNISNIGPKITYIDQKQADPLPTNLKAGLAYTAYDDGFNKLNVIYDLNKLLVYRKKLTVQDSSGTPDNFLKAIFWSSWTKYSFSEQLRRLTHSIGVEYYYGSLIALRTGFFYEDPSYGARKFFTFGGGLEVSMFKFDFSYLYTWSDEEHPLSDTMRYSLTISF